MKRTSYGYVKFSLVGTECEKFISDAIAEGIKVFDIENEKGVVYAKTPPSQYSHLARLKRRYYIQMRIREKGGLALKLYRYRNRYGLLFGALTYGIVLLMCSSIVWDISIQGNKDITDESILDFLAENGIHAGVKRKSLENTLTELKALLNFDRLAWISIETEGSRVNVKISERLSNSVNGLSVSTPCNVVALKGGRITDAQINRGTMLYEVGSGVAEGDIIVSGIVNDGAGNITVQHADAIVIAEYEENISFYKEFNTVETVKTNDRTVKEYIKFFGFTFPKKNAEFTQGYSYSSDSYRVELMGITMPWTRTVVEGIRTEEVEVTRTVNDVKRLLQNELENYERNFLGNVEIIDREITYDRDEKGIRINCKYTLQGDIAGQSEIFYRE